MTARFRRSLFRLLAGLLLLGAILWLAFPFWIGPAAAPFLRDAGVHLEQLDMARPMPSGVEIARLALTTGATHIELRDATVRWRLDGHLTLVDVEHLSARIEADPDAASVSAGESTPAALLPDPADLLGALPAERIRLGTVAVDVPARALRVEGHAELDRRQARLTGTVASLLLPTPLAFRGSFEVGRPLRLQIDGAPGAPLLDAELDLAIEPDSVAAEGRVTTRAGLLPLLVADAPELEGTLLLALRLSPEASELALLPGTELEVRAAEPDVLVISRPATPWRLHWREGRLSTDGSLPFELAAMLPTGAGEAPLEAAGRLVLSSLAGTPVAPEFETRGTLRLGRLAEAALILNGALQSGEQLRLDAGSGLEAVRFREPEAGITLTGGALRLATALRLELPSLTWAPTRFEAGVAALGLGEADLDLSALRAEFVLAGSADAPVLEARIDGAGLDLAASAARLDDAWSVTDGRGRIDLGPGDFAPALLRPFVPELELRDGTLELAVPLWPPGDGRAVAADLSGLDATLAGTRLEGLGVRAELHLDGGDARLPLVEGSLARVETGALQAEDIAFDAAGHLPGWHGAAAARGELPGALHLDAVELRAGRLEADAGHLDTLAVQGSARFDGRGLRADGELSAPSLMATVPASDLHCRGALENGQLELRDCGLAVLGGRVEVPQADIELATRSGYLPVALLGLDLGAVLLLMQDEALTGDGVLDGALPLRLADGVPTVRDGYLGARPPGGRLRYAADAALLERLNQPGLSLAMTALGDFRYRELGARVDYEADGTLDLRVRLAGASPRVEAGRAIEFNLDVTQNLPLLLQSLRLSQTIGEAIERRLEERNAPR